MTNIEQRTLEVREAVLNRALDEPWLYSGDETDEELWEELLDVERQLGHTALWPHTL